MANLCHTNIFRCSGRHDVTTPRSAPTADIMTAMKVSCEIVICIPFFDRVSWVGCKIIFICYYYYYCVCVCVCVCLLVRMLDIEQDNDLIYYDNNNTNINTSTTNNNNNNNNNNKRCSY